MLGKVRFLPVVLAVAGLALGSAACAHDADVDAGASDLATAPAASLDLSTLHAPVLVSNEFFFTEGPVWDPKNDVLYFTDINAQQDGKTGGAIYRLTLPDKIEVVLQPAGNADGLALDPQGNILAAGYASRNVWRLSDSKMQTLGACAGGVATCFEGKQLNTPDDLTVRADGVVYFTDPTFGSGSQGLPSQDLPLASAQGLYRIDAIGQIHLEDTSALGLNGVNLSPDQKTLYVAHTLGLAVVKYDVQADGSLANKTTFASGLDLTFADSMCVDSAGNVYVGTLTGLAVIGPTGNELGKISVNGEVVTNCAFGGHDQKTLFITTRTSALPIAPEKGASSLYRIDDMPVPGIPGQN